ncbi:DUF3445 domain-containing protein [Alphaproteobacteria bacterium]|nr:DUF3445 domain-containing protein [Alphaproteobacteria bacterium]
MIDWKKYGPIYTIAPGIKKLGKLPIIEFDNEEERYLNLKKKSYDNIYFDKLFNNKIDSKVVQKIKNILLLEYPKKKIAFQNFEEMGYSLQEDVAIFHRSNKLIALHVSFPSMWIPEEKIGMSFSAIHQPVPGMKKFLENEKKYVNMMVDAKEPIIRYVWGEHFGYLLSPLESIDKELKVIHTERQTFVGIPEEDLGIFLIKKKVMLFNDTDIEFQQWYKKQITSMSEEQKKYKIGV